MIDSGVRDNRPPRLVERIGGTVRRPVAPWTPAVHALLRHLEEMGFAFSPRVLGIDRQGREVLTYLEGESGPAGRTRVTTDDGLRQVGRLLRDYHDAVAGWRRDPDLVWSSGVHERGAPDNPDEVVCHGDFGPWNLVWRAGRCVGILDWDFAHPAPARHDVVQAVEHLAPFRDDVACVRDLGYAAPPDRQHRVAVFASAYGLDSPADLVDAVVARQRETAETVRRLAAAGCEPQATWAARGYVDLLERRIAQTRALRDALDG